MRNAARVSASDRGHADIEVAGASPTFRCTDDGHIHVAHMILKVVAIPHLKGIVGGNHTLVYACDQAHTEIAYTLSKKFVQTRTGRIQQHSSQCMHARDAV